MSRPLRTLPEHFVTLSEFQADPARWLRRVEKTNGPALLSYDDGKPAGYLVSPLTFHGLTLRALYLEEMEAGFPEPCSGYFPDPSLGDS